ncbi:MAG: RidA family protein [Rhodobacteraceae bacterium]|nr:RidA family protein [Paracoccaceae bacterium]
MSTITRLDSGPRMSQAVVNNGTIYLAGQVGTADASITEQTQDILKKIDALLERTGSDKHHMLQAVIWLSDMKHFAEMNAVWDAWVEEGSTPARACGEAKLATPSFDVEIIVTAAVKG